MGVQYQPSPVDARSPEAQTVGEGPIFVFSDGQFIEGRWKRELGIYPLNFFDTRRQPDRAVARATRGSSWPNEVPTIDPAKTGVDMIVKPAA